MNIEPVPVLRGERAACEKLELGWVELPARPFDRQHRLIVHALGRADRRRVVIAEQRDGAARGVLLHRVEDKSRIGAVADIVAKKDVALDRMALGMGETCFQRLAVAVDVGEDRDQHESQNRLPPGTARATAKRNGGPPGGPPLSFQLVSSLLFRSRSRSRSARRAVRRRLARGGGPRVVLLERRSGLQLVLGHRETKLEVVVVVAAARAAAAGVPAAAAGAAAAGAAAVRASGYH